MMKFYEAKDKQIVERLRDWFKRDSSARDFASSIAKEIGCEIGSVRSSGEAIYALKFDEKPGVQFTKFRGSDEWYQPSKRAPKALKEKWAKLQSMIPNVSDFHDVVGGMCMFASGGRMAVSFPQAWKSGNRFGFALNDEADQPKYSSGLVRLSDVEFEKLQKSPRRKK